MTSPFPTHPALQAPALPVSEAMNDEVLLSSLKLLRQTSAEFGLPPPSFHGRQAMRLLIALARAGAAGGAAPGRRPLVTRTPRAPTADASPHSPPSHQPHSPTAHRIAFAADPLAPELVARVLADAFEHRHAACWGRSAPSALNWQRIAVHALLPEGAFRFDDGRHRLEPLHRGDLRPTTAGGRPAPATLVYVANFDRVERSHAEEHGWLTGADASVIVDSVHDCAARAGLASTVDGSVSREALAAALALGRSERILLAQHLGRPRVANPPPSA